MATRGITPPKNISAIQKSARSTKARRTCSFRRSQSTYLDEPMKSMRVLYHDNCFDGVSSAAVFSRFYRAHVNQKAEIEYEGLTHKASQRIGPDSFGSGENAIVDFKYSASEKLTWWFDHHESAFLSSEDESHFRRDNSGHKFHDPTFKSCTKYIAHIAKTVFGVSAPDLDDLVYWADIIDGAQFAS